MNENKISKVERFRQFKKEFARLPGYQFDRGGEEVVKESPFLGVEVLRRGTISRLLSL